MTLQEQNRLLPIFMRANKDGTVGQFARMVWNLDKEAEMKALPKYDTSNASIRKEFKKMV